MTTAGTTVVDGGSAAAAAAAVAAMEEASPGTKAEIRAVLLRHWRALDRTRLHLLHLWLIIYSLAQVFIAWYLNQVGSFILFTFPFAICLSLSCDD